MAEGEGFEPPLPFRVKRFSRPPVSTTHTSLRKKGRWAYLNITVSHSILKTVSTPCPIALPLTFYP